MRRLAAPLALSAALAASGCGGDDGSPLANALGYLPQDAPLAVAIDTDLEGDQYQAVGKIAERFPFGDRLVEGLKQELEEQGLNFERDVEPLLGNPFVLGAVDAGNLARDREENFVGAIDTEDGDKAKEVVGRIEGSEELGQRDGATAYRSADGDFYAVDGDVLVIADTEQLLDDALGRDDGLGEDDFNRALDGLSDDALVRVSADLQALIASDPEARAARQIEWVGALRRLGLAAAAREDRVDVEFVVGTEAGELSEEDLPIAAGDASPPIVRQRGDISFALRDPRQIVRFAERAARAADAAGFGRYAAAKRQLERRLGIRFEDDLLAQLTGDVSVVTGVDRKFALRAQLEDAAAFERTLARVADELPGVLEGSGGGRFSLAKPERGEDYYALAERGGDTAVFGVVDDALIVANDPARADRIAAASAAKLEGAEGSVVLAADAGAVVQRALAEAEGLGGALGGALFTGPLGELTGSLSAETDGLRGRLALGFD